MNKKKSKKKSTSKNKALLRSSKNKTSFQSLYWVWVASMVIFLVTYWFTNATILLSENILFLMFVVLIGGIAFLGLFKSLFKEIFSKNEDIRFEAQTYLLGSIGVFVLFFLLFARINNSFEANNPSDIQESSIEEFKKCYFDDTWIQVSQDADCDKEISDFRAAQTLKPTVNPSVQPTSTSTNEKNEVNSEDLWKVEKINEVTTDTQFPADSRMGTPEELFIAINNYRSVHSISQVQKHDTLCRIAQTRANQLLELGGLDQHAGMDSLAHSQQDFNNMGEVIGGGAQKQLAVHTVEWGWGRSLTGHRESILNPKWSHGCGGIAGLFNVFVFGNN